MMKKTLTTFLLLLILISAVMSQEKSVSPALAELAASERAFARYSVEHNVRDAFIKFFADEGINFQPHPIKTRETLSAQPAPPSPPPAVLNWAPILGDIAAAGDLGYTTGPFTVEDRTPQKRPTRHGMYFSVWRREATGEWRVLLDIGIQTPSAVAPLDAPFVAARTEAAKRSGKIDEKAERDKLLALERELFGAAGRGVGAAYIKSLDNEARMHRQQMMPLLGKQTIVGWLTGEARQMSGEPIDGRVSRSGDLGYAYGRYELKTGDRIEKGHYGRVWKYTHDGWRIVAEIVNPLPPQS